MRGLAVLVLTLGLTTLVLTRPAAGAPHKILVLPVDGTADAATRAKLTTQLSRLAKGLDGQVATADATFADTALAVGCDPQAPHCSDEVMATLGVDELVWGTATRDAGQTKLVVRRAARGQPAREVSTVIAANDSTERIDAGMAPLFAPPGAAPEPTARPSASASAPAPAPAQAPVPAAVRPGPDAVAAAPTRTEPAPRPVAPGPEDDHRDRSLGIAFAVGGGVGLVLGLALWASYEGLQDSIDSHATNTRADFDDLTALEDRASTYAIAGDVLVIAGLAAGGLAAYYLVKDHHRRHVAITPAPIAHGAVLTLTITGGL